MTVAQRQVEAVDVLLLSILCVCVCVIASLPATLTFKFSLLIWIKPSASVYA